MEQIELLNKIHHLFYTNYKHLIDKEDQEILNKKNEIDIFNILSKYQFYKNFLQQNNFSNQNKEQLSNELLELATNIYELSLIIEDVNKLKN